MKTRREWCRIIKNRAELQQDETKKKNSREKMSWKWKQKSWTLNVIALLQLRFCCIFIFISYSDTLFASLRWRRRSDEVIVEREEWRLNHFVYHKTPSLYSLVRNGAISARATYRRSWLSVYDCHTTASYDYLNFMTTVMEEKKFEDSLPLSCYERTWSLRTLEFLQDFLCVCQS